jgi:hypothetical protein
VLPAKGKGAANDVAVGSCRMALKDIRWNIVDNMARGVSFRKLYSIKSFLAV